MTAVVGARRALLAARYSPRGAIAASTALVPPYRRLDSLLRLPAERGCVSSWVPHRGAGSVASERTDEDCDSEWGQNNAGSYENFRSNHFSHQLQRDAPSAGSRSAANISGGSEQTYGSGGLDKEGKKEMASMLAQMDRVLIKSRENSPNVGARTAIAASTAPDPPYQRVDSLHRLPAERGGVPSSVPHRGAGSLASERTDEDCHHEWGQNNAGSYGNSRSNSNHFIHQLQSDAPSAGSRSAANIGGGSEQPYRSGGSYGSLSANHPYTGASATNEQPGYDATQYSPRGPIAASAPPDAPYRHVDSLPRLPDERGCVPSWIPHRGAGSLASERADEDCRREWGENNAGSYGNSHSNHFSHQLQRDASSAGSRSVANIGGGSEQPYRSGGSYCSPNANMPYTGARSTSEQPGCDETQYSPCGAIAESAAPELPYRRIDSLPRLPAERGCVPSWVPHQGAGSFASERTDEYCHREWGESNAGSYGNFRSNHCSHQLQRDAPSAGSRSFVNIAGGSEQPYRGGGSYGSPSANQLYNFGRATNEQPGYDATQYSPRGAIVASAVPDPSYRHVDSLPSLPAERGGVPSWVPHRGAGSLASERTDDDCHREWGENNSGSYGNSRSNHFSHQLQRDAPSAGSRSPANHGGGSEQPYRSGGSYGSPNANHPYTGARATNEQPGYDAMQYSPRGAIVTSAAPDAPYRHIDSLPRLPAERGCVPSWIPHQGAGSLASERTDEDCGREWGENNAGTYGNSRSNHFGHQLQRDAPSAGSRSFVNIGGGSVQPYRSGGSYGSLNANQPYTCARATNEQPGYDAIQSCRTSSAYNQQSHGGHLPNAHLRYNGAEANNTQSGYGKGQTYHGHYGYGPSGQGPNSVGYDQEVFRQQQYVDHRSGGGCPDRPGNSTSQYANPTHSHKEHVAGFQQGSTSNYGCNAPQASQSPYVPSQADTRSTPQGYSMYLNTDAQCLPRGIHQEKHPCVQPTTSFGNHSDSAPHQGDIYYQPLPGNPSNDGSPSEVSNEVSRIREGTVEELEKLCEDGNIKEALEVQAMLQRNGTMLHARQYFKLMQACGDAIALEEARVIHSQMSESSIVVDTDVQNKILEMYAKCGSMEDAKNLFSTMDHRSLASWNTMISGFVHNGHGEEATDFFDQFKQTGDKPDAVMFTHIFLACGILGSVDEGMLHFESMQKDFGITPTMEHYASIVSMLGQSGYIAEAHEFVERIPVEPSIEVWENLMNMCRLNGFLELGDRCAQIVERLDSSRLNEQSKMGLFPVDASDLAKEKGRKKGSVAEARSKVHEYRAGDRSHPDTLKIYEELRYLSAHMKEAGYIADTRFVLHDVDQETKEDALLAHSERLAISYGLITSAPRSPIRVIKNLRSCGDCHTAFKIISKLVGRLIIARDAKRFHHFENGVCSCKDYW